MAGDVRGFWVLIIPFISPHANDWGHSVTMMKSGTFRNKDDIGDRDRDIPQGTESGGQVH